MLNKKQGIGLENFNPAVLKQTTHRNSRIKRTVSIILALVFLYVFGAGDFGFYNLYLKKQQESNLQSEISSLNKEAEDLNAEKAMLQKKSPEYMERIAREKYDMAKKGEKVYKVVTKK